MGGRPGEHVLRHTGVLARQLAVSGRCCLCVGAWGKRGADVGHETCLMLGSAHACTERQEGASSSLPTETADQTHVPGSGKAKAPCLPKETRGSKACAREDLNLTRPP